MGKLAKETHGQCNCQMLAKGGAVKSNPFEKSKKDKEPKGMKEGSKKEEKFDFKQMKKGGKCK